MKNEYENSTDTKSPSHPDAAQSAAPQLVLDIPVDTPLSLRWRGDAGTLLMEVRVPHPVHPEGMVFRLHMTAEATLRLGQAIADFEANADTPPSAHAKPRTRQ